MGLGKLACGATCAKYILVAFNFCFFLSGVALLAVGIWARVDSDSLAKNFDKYLEVSNDVSNDFMAGAILFIVVGVFIFVVGFCGCCGALKENKCLLGIYIILLVLVLLAEITAVILAVVFRKNLEDGIKDGGKKVIRSDYKNRADNSIDRAWNFIMHTYKCCGMNGPGDFVNSTYTKNSKKNVSPFCCKTVTGANETYINPSDEAKCQSEARDCASSSGCKTPTELYTKGCYEVAVDLIKDNYVVFVGVGAGLAGLEIFGLIFAICVCRAIGKDDQYQ